MDNAFQLLAVLASPLFGLAGVWLGGHLQAKKDDARWQRELDREAERWGREDRRKWLDEQHKIYGELMAKISDAVYRMGLAYDYHLSVVAGVGTDLGEADQRQLEEAAKQATAAIGPVIESSALLAHSSVYELARGVQSRLALTAYMVGIGNRGEAVNRLRRARRDAVTLRSRIREELGVDVPTPLDGDEEPVADQ